MRPLAATVLSLLCTLPGQGFAYEDGAPPGHSGGHGEAHCGVCHSDNDVNPGEGKLEIEGLPDSFSAGTLYRLSLVIAHPELRSAGFQLAARDEGGATAGQLSSSDPDVEEVASGDQSYLQHRHPVRDSGTHRVRWRFTWRAPEIESTVTFDVAANSANDDSSALGDQILLTSVTITPSE